MKIDTYRRCRTRVAFAAALLALLPIPPDSLASDDANLTESSASANAEPVDCSKGGGKAHMLRCAMRSLDRMRGGQWLKWAIGAAVLIGVPYLTLQHLIGFWRRLKSEAPNDANDDRRS